MERSELHRWPRARALRVLAPWPREVRFLGRLLLTGTLLFACARGLMVAFLADRLAGIPAGDLVRAFAVGAWHDVTFLAWPLVPVWVLLFARRGALPTRPRLRRAVEVWVGVCTFLLLVGVASDLAHFREFGVRLNGASMDYLRQPLHLLTVLHHEFFLGPVVAGLLGVSWFAVRRARHHLARLRPAAHAAPRTAAAWSGTALAALLLGGAVPAWAGDSPAPGPSASFAPRTYVANQLAANGTSRFVAACLHGLAPESAAAGPLSTLWAPGAEDVVRATVHRTGERVLDEATHPLARVTPAARPATGRNVVVVMSESLAARGIRSLGGRHDDAPCFDALAADGVLFTNHFAVGTRTNRALAGVLASLPSLPGQSPVCALRPGDRMQTIAGVLARQGYRSVAVYGGDRQYDNLEVLTRGNGFDRLVALDDFASPRFRTEWGVSDEDVFDRALRELDALAAGQEPFFGFVLTLSNHRPHRVPPGRVAPADPDDPLGAAREAFRYADHALGRFLDAARRADWFDDTLFVIVADHGADVRSGAAPDVESLRVPLLLYAPAFLPPRRIDALASQVDVLPTIVGLVGGEHAHCSFGRDLLAGEPPGRAMMCIGDVLLWRQADLLTAWRVDGQEEAFTTAADGTLVPLAPGRRRDEVRAHARRLRATTRVAFDVSRRAAHHLGRGESPAAAASRYDPRK